MMLGGGLVVGLVLLAFFLVLIAGAIGVSVWIAKRGSQSSEQKPGPRVEGEEAALEILRQRYARGEIDRQEFQRMRKEIGS